MRFGRVHKKRQNGYVALFAYIAEFLIAEYDAVKTKSEGDVLLLQFACLFDVFVHIYDVEPFFGKSRGRFFKEQVDRVVLRNDGRNEDCFHKL